MGFPKPLLRIDGETFLRRTVGAMLQVVRNLIVVSGAHEARVKAEIPSDGRITRVHNADFLRGQLSSLKCAIRALPDDSGAVLVHLADHPLVRSSTFREVADRYGDCGYPIVIARHSGRRGHPVLFSRGVFAELLAAPDEEGARFVVNADAGRVVYVDVEDPGVTLDLDTPEDLERVGLPGVPEEDR